MKAWIIVYFHQNQYLKKLYAEYVFPFCVITNRIAKIHWIETSVQNTRQSMNLLIQRLSPCSKTIWSWAKFELKSHYLSFRMIWVFRSDSLASLKCHVIGEWTFSLLTFMLINADRQLGLFVLATYWDDRKPKHSRNYNHRF